MIISETSQLNNKELNDILSLWNSEYPESLRHENLDSLKTYLNGLDHKRHLILLNAKSEIIGWYLDFIREDQLWFAMIVDSKHHKSGFGSRLIEKAKSTQNELSGWVIDHNSMPLQSEEIYQSPLDFYLKKDFKIISDIRLELPEISAVKIYWKKTQ